MPTKKVKIDKSNFGDLLVESLSEALGHAEGKITLKNELLETPKTPPVYSKNKIKKIREEILKVSQPIFAMLLGCSTSCVRSWERGENQPDGMARRLLQLIENDPKHFLGMIISKKAA